MTNIKIYHFPQQEIFLNRFEKHQLNSEYFKYRKISKKIAEIIYISEKIDDAGFSESTIHTIIKKVVEHDVSLYKPPNDVMKQNMFDIIEDCVVVEFRNFG